MLGLGFMLMGENSAEVTRGLKRKLAEVQTALPKDVKVEVLYDRTELVDNVIDTVKHNLLAGALLVIAILFAFLGNLRAGLVVAAAIPLSMLFAGDLMLQAGISARLAQPGGGGFRAHRGRLGGDGRECDAATGGAAAGVGGAR